MESTTKDTEAANPATEAKAIAAVVEALEGLDAPAISRILDWASKRYGASARRSQERANGGRSKHEEDAVFADLAELYNAAGPRTETDKMLVAGYWHQALQGHENFDSQTLNTNLKNLGHGIGNVTRACYKLIRQRPALMMQVQKSGSTQQARKLYRLTSAGIERVRKMTAGEPVEAVSEE